MNTWDKCLFQGVATINCIQVVFSNLISFLFMAAGTVAFFVILYAGLRFILASGDSKQLEGARKILIFGIAGLLLVLMSYVLLNVIATVTGVNCILAFGPFTPSVTINGHTYVNCFVH